MSLDYNKKNVVLAKNLRKMATRQEKHLWYDFLAKYQPLFQRQINTNFHGVCEYIDDVVKEALAETK